MSKRSETALTAAAEAFLPATDESLRCAEYSRSRNVDAGGTAIDVSAIALVEVPLPWPKPVFEHPLLTSIQQKFRTPNGPGRVLATVPNSGASVDGRTRVVLYERSGGTATCKAFLVVGATELSSLFTYIEAGRADETSFAVAPPASAEAVLVCTQGSHDVCCGTEGVRLADRLVADDPGRTVFRVSHTGGHRFAPTAMTLPDGRMWADADSRLVPQLIDRTVDVGTAARHCRGWWGAASGWEQMAERAVFELEGWAFNDEDRQVETESATDHEARCVVRSGDRVWNVDIEVGREIPTIACRAEGGLPAKPGREYRIRSVTPRP